MKVRYVRKALRQLDEIYSYIEQHNPRSARRVTFRIKQAIERLATMPYSCRETELPGMRVLSIARYPYLVFYSVEEATQEVHIHRIRHAARDPKRHLD